MVVKVSYIPNRVKNPSKEHPYVAGAVDIIDDVKEKSQAQVNKDVDDALTLHQSEINALDSENYVTVGTYSDLPEEGSVDTIYRVCNWDGSANSGAGAVDATVYSQYAWDATNSEYKLLDVKTAVGEVFDISLYHASGGVLATYADLSAALAAIPQSAKRPGMRIQYVSSSDNKYVQFRFMLSTFTAAQFTNPANWQGVDDEPTAGSENPVKSGGVYKPLKQIELEEHGVVQDSVSLGTDPNTPKVVLRGINLKKDVTYKIEAKSSAQATATLYVILYAKDGTNLKNVNIDSGNSERTLYYRADNNYKDVYVATNGRGMNNFIVTATITEGDGGNISIDGKLDSLYGKDCKELRFEIATANTSQNIDFSTVVNHKYRVYLPKDVWTIETVNNGTVFVVRSKSDGSYSDISGTNYNKDTFNSIGNYVDFTATTETSNILIRSDINIGLFFTIADITEHPTKEVCENLEKELSAYDLNDIERQKLVTNGKLSYSIDLVKGTKDIDSFVLVPQKKYKITATLSASFTGRYYVYIKYAPDWNTLASVIIDPGVLTNSAVFAVSKFMSVKVETYTATLQNGQTVSINIEEIEDYNITRSVIGLNCLRNNRYYCHLFANNDPENTIIPFESPYDISIAKRLGFNVIEGNVQVSSDGQYFVLHGRSGAFGPLFYHIDGTTDISSTLVSSVTAEWIKTNVRFRSIYAKYRTEILTLEEWLRICRIHDMTPLVQIQDIEEYPIIDNIMGKGNYIAYSGNRKYTAGLISGANMNYINVSDILAYGDEIGRGIPFMYSMPPEILNQLTDEQLTGIVTAIHQRGWFVSTNYLNESQNQRAKRLGFDMVAAMNEINPILQGNLLDICLGSTISDFNTEGSFADGVLTLSDNQVVSPSETLQSVFLGAMSLYIRFNGTISISIGKIQQNIDSNGKYPMIISSYCLESSPTFSIRAIGSVTLYDLTFKSSKR